MRNSAVFLLSVVVLSLFVLSACGEEAGGPFDGETAYCSDAELALRESCVDLLENPSEWNLQYPSGSEERGMLIVPLTDGYKSKYFSKYTDARGVPYMRFSLSAADKGKSKNGSSVRAELSHRRNWLITGKQSLSYSFYLTSTDFGTAKFTVGQFLMHCTLKDSPLCRIEVENGRITAMVINYQSDGKIKADGKTWKYDMGSIAQRQEVSIKIAVENKVLTLYRDGEAKATHKFHESVDASLGCYFKAGIYYQNKDSPNIFSEIFMRNVKVEL